jgi:uncharacterized membrane protein
MTAGLLWGSEAESMKADGHQLKAEICALIICLVGFALLLYRLDEKSLWADETFVAEVVRLDLRPLVSATAADVHPPLYFVGMWIWTRLAGVNEFTLRFPSVIFGTLSAATLYALGSRVMSRSVGVMAMAVMAISPFFILYSRMARYYSLVLFLSLVSYWFFCQLLDGRASVRNWMGYIVASTLAIYTYYAAAFILLAQAIDTLGRMRHHRQLVTQFLGSQILVMLLVAPWIPVWTAQTVGLGARLDAFGGTSVTMWLLSTVYPFFGWTAGETVYPWNPAGLVSVILGVSLASGGLLSSRRTPNCDAMQEADAKEGRQLQVTEHSSLRFDPHLGSFWTQQSLAALLFILLPLLLTVAAVRWFASGESFLAVPSRAICCLPFMYLLVGRGICTITNSAARLVVVTVLASVLGLSVANCYLGREFHNPNYVLQTEPLADSIGEQAESGDVVISDYMTAVGYYINKRNPQVAHFFAHDPQAAKNHIQKRHSARVWLILLCRAVETESLATVELVPWLLEEGYSLELARGYGPLDQTYARLQEFILGKPACKYKVVLYRYARLQRELVGAAQ